jgi:inosine-uridine nucleoside N-ribohydrolase
VVRLPAFEGKDWVPTFNLNGDRKGADALLSTRMAGRRWVGKNVCHTVGYDASRHVLMRKPSSAAGELFMEAMGLYLEGHPEKKFHDPTAAACLLRPDIGMWVKGRPVRREGGWTTQVDPEGDLVLAGIDHERLWTLLGSWGQES